jgi:hypothetical protein
VAGDDCHPLPSYHSLTHRAVDREAGLAEGSTSNYFGTREALLTAALAGPSAPQVLAALDGLMVNQIFQSVIRLTPDQIVDQLERLFASC